MMIRRAHRIDPTLALEISLALALALAVPGAAQSGSSASPACNDTTRENDITAGDHNFSNEPCQTLTFTVLGQSFSTPNECIRGGAHYAGTVYKCSGALEGFHCNPRGWDVAVTTYAEGACPKLPTLDIDEWQWDSWSKVPTALEEAMQCKPPQKKEDKDKSATVSACEAGVYMPSLESGEVYISAGGTTFVAWTGAPHALVGETGTWSLFLTPYDLAQTGTGAQWSGTMGAVAQGHSIPPGFHLQVDVTIEHFDGPAAPPANVYTASVTGGFTADGRIDVVKAVAMADEDGSPGSALHETKFDGTVLQALLHGAEYGNAIAESYPQMAVMKATYTASLEPLFWWVHDPFELPLFPDASFVETAGPGPGQVAAMRSFTGAGGPFVGGTYLIDVGGAQAHPVSNAVTGSDGSVWRDVRYSNFARYAAGTWRPRTVVSTHYLDGSPTGARIVTTVRILHAAVLTQEQADAVPTPFGPQVRWQVWM